MSTTLTSLRRAALVVASLDPREADSLLEQFPERQAGLLRRVMAELGEIDEHEQQEALREFLAPVRRGSQSPAGQASDRQTLSPRGEPRGAAFRFLEQAAGESVLPFLAQEHPQTIAVVVSRLAPERAAGVLAGLAPQVIADVLNRLGDLDEADPDAVRDVELGLESRFQEQARAAQRRAAGAAMVEAILQAASPTMRRKLMASLAEAQNGLSHRLVSCRIGFADFEWMASAALAAIYAEAGPELARLALVGAGEKLIDRMASALPPHDARALRQSLNQLGPTRLSDVEDAQRALAAAAERLAAQGRLDWPLSRE
jgi:flagellar motor switch protein FliG